MKIIQLSKNLDNRGIFKRLFCLKEFKKRKIYSEIKQINISFNYKKYTLRGLHYQKGSLAEEKIIYCTKGKFFFVSLNIDKKSKKYLEYESVTLEENDDKVIYVEKQRATGFLTLKKNTELIYFMTNYYNQKHSDGILYNDPKINIHWPYKPLVISVKDKSFKRL